MTSKKKAIPKDPEPSNLRRSSRATRGSVKPVINLAEKDSEAEMDEDVPIEDVEEEDEDFTETKPKKASTRKSISKRVSVKKEPVKKDPVKKETVKKEPAKRGAGRKSTAKSEPIDTKESVKSEVVEDLPSGNAGKDDDELEGDDGAETYYELSEMELKDANHAFDLSRISDEEELLNADGLRTAMRSLGFEPRGDEIKKLLKTFAKKANKVNRDGFHKIMALKYGSAPGTKLNNLNDEISRVFNLLDLDKTGLITVENLKSISRELNEDITEEELYEMISEADLDGDSMINKQEFQNIMVKTSLY